MSRPPRLPSVLADPVHAATLDWLAAVSATDSDAAPRPDPADIAGIVTALVLLLLAPPRMIPAAHADGLRRLAADLTETPPIVADAGDAGASYAAILRALGAVLPPLDARLVAELDRLLAAVPAPAGRAWVTATYERWCQIVPGPSLRTIKRAIRRLESREIVIATRANDDARDRTKAYTLAYDHTLLAGILSPPDRVAAAPPAGDAMSPARALGDGTRIAVAGLAKGDDMTPAEASATTTPALSNSPRREERRVERVDSAANLERPALTDDGVVVAPEEPVPTAVIAPDVAPITSVPPMTVLTAPLDQSVLPGLDPGTILPTRPRRRR